MARGIRLAHADGGPQSRHGSRRAHRDDRPPKGITMKKIALAALHRPAGRDLAPPVDLTTS
jgi:hypothetical protein